MATAAGALATLRLEKRRQRRCEDLGVYIVRLFRQGLVLGMWDGLGQRFIRRSHKRQRLVACTTVHDQRRHSHGCRSRGWYTSIWAECHCVIRQRWRHCFHDLPHWRLSRACHHLLGSANEAHEQGRRLSTLVSCEEL